MRRILSRLLKGIIITKPKNINRAKTAYLTRNCVINASNGTVLLGEKTIVGNYTQIVPWGGKAINIQDYSTINSNCKLLGEIEIKRYCVLASNIYISSGNHYAFNRPEILIKKQDQEALSTKEGRANHSKKVLINEDAWIGAGVFIARGITIGRGAVIGSNSVVTKDVLPYEVVGGAPARRIKKRLDFVPPQKIDSGISSSFPYFYSGFDHMEDEQVFAQNGFKILDTESSVIVTSSKSGYRINGSCTPPLKMKVRIDNQEFDFQCEDQNFTFIVDANCEPTLPTQTIYIHSHLNNSIRIQSVESNDY